MAYKMKGFSGFKSSPVKKENKYYRGTGMTKEEFYDKKYKEELDAKARYEKKHAPVPDIKAPKPEPKTATREKKYNKERHQQLDAKMEELKRKHEEGQKFTKNNTKPKPHKKPLSEIHESSTPVKHGNTPLHKKSLVDKVQTGLSAAGMAPVYGAPADWLNTGISAGRSLKARLKGDKKGAKKHIKAAGLNLVSSVPGVGDAVAAKTISDDLGYEKKEHKWKANIPEKGYRDIKKA